MISSPLEVNMDVSTPVGVTVCALCKASFKARGTSCCVLPCIVVGGVIVVPVNGAIIRLGYDNGESSSSIGTRIASIVGVVSRF